MGLLDDITFSQKRRTHWRQIEANANDLLTGKKTRRGKRLKHKRKIPKMTYRSYMKSRYWKKRKNDYFGKFGKRCEVCGKRAGVTLHHKKYDPELYGKEPDDFFVALCEYHHNEFHTNHLTSSDMTTETDLYVATAKQIEQFDKDIGWLSNHCA